MQTRRRKPLLARLTSKVILGPAPESDPSLGPCWLWTGALTTAGYASVGVRENDGPMVTAYGHRVVYELVAGRIPEGLELDHLCRIRHCVNPLHLDAVTHRVNTGRGTAGEVARARSLSTTHCTNGHPRTTENTQLTAEGWHRCRLCSRDRCRRYRQTRKAVA